MGERDRVREFLFHLGKGLWKSVPVLGPIVEEVLYEQFKTELEGRVDQLSCADVARIAAALPKLKMEELERKLAGISEEQRRATVTELTAVLSDASADHARMESKLDGVVERLPSLEGMLSKVLRQSDHADAVHYALDALARRREAWVNRISQHQRELLARIPAEYTSVDTLWQVTRELIPECGYKEFRLRLHELEWLDLVTRYRDAEGTWRYRRCGTVPGGGEGVD